MIPHQPKTPDELHRWIVDCTQLKVPRCPVCPGHHAPFDYLRTAWFEPSRDQVVWAPRGGGKTSLAAVATLLDLIYKPGIAIRILGGSLEQSLRLWDSLLPHLEGVGDDQIDRQHGTARRIRLQNGSTAAVLTQSQRSVRGQRVQKLRCDEVELFDPRVWEAAQLVTRSRCLGDDGAGVMVRGTIEAMSTLHKPFGLMQQIVRDAEQSADPGTAPAGASPTRLVRWCILEVLERCPPDRACQTCPLHPECRGIAKTHCDGFFPIDDAIVMKSRVSQETWESEMLCLRPSITGRVFPRFARDTHVRSEAPFAIDASCEWWLAIDFGFHNPFVCLWIVRRGEEFYVIDEYAQQYRTIDQHLVEITQRRWPRVPRIACDPAGNGRSDQTATSNVELLRKHGYQVKTRGSGIIEGVERVRAALRSATGRTRLTLHPRCTGLTRALQEYHYPDAGGELPVKDGTHDHYIDALRYYLANCDSARISTRSY